MEKTYKLNMYGKTYNIALRKTTYRNNDTLAIIMMCIGKKGYEEDFGTLTVNIDDSDLLADETSAFVDTNNLGSEIVDWLVKNKIANTTPFIGRSGFCSYPLVMFDDKVVENMVEYA